ncbi:MAG: hypothetical protein MHPSP_003662, partial [Paramarteilia canceri]
MDELISGNFSNIGLEKATHVPKLPTLEELNEKADSSMIFDVEIKPSSKFELNMDYNEQLKYLYKCLK